jgi:ribosomal protein L19E
MDLRNKIKGKRAERAVPTRTWMKTERERILRKDIYGPILTMYRDSMAISPAWASEYRKFWDLPKGFNY